MKGDSPLQILKRVIIKIINHCPLSQKKIILNWKWQKHCSLKSHLKKNIHMVCVLKYVVYNYKIPINFNWYLCLDWSLVEKLLCHQCQMIWGSHGLQHFLQTLKGPTIFKNEINDCNWLAQFSHFKWPVRRHLMCYSIRTNQWMIYRSVFT